ncbi:MAG: PD40 domain-containing protein, partial [Anaerolineales bacterium]|nr:PD40 domain-containing protein [Anaerolineales bacterium]
MLFALQQNLNLSAMLPHDAWGWAEAVAFSPDGKLLAVSHTAGQISLYDLTLKPIEERILVGLDTTSDHATSRTQVAFSPDGRYIAATVHNGPDSLHEVAVWDSQSLELVATGPEGWNQFAFSADGEHLIGRDRTRVSSWKFAPGHPLEEVASTVIGDDSNLAYAPMAVHPLDSLVAYGSAEGLINFWDPDSGETVSLADERVNESIVHLTFSPDGTTLAISTNSSLHLWNMARREMVGTIQDVLPMVAFSRDGQKLLVAQRDESL